MIALEAHSPTAAAEKSLLLRFVQFLHLLAPPRRTARSRVGTPTFSKLSDQPRKLLSNQARVSRSFDRQPRKINALSLDARPANGPRQVPPPDHESAWHPGT